MNWVRLDCNFSSNHKVLALLDERGGATAVNAYVFGLGHSAGHGQAGFIPRAALGTFHAKPRDAGLLVDVGLWEQIAGGWDIHSFAEFQPADEDATKRSEKAKHAAEVRWAKKRGEATT